MPKYDTAQVFKIAETHVNEPAMRKMLAAIGAPDDWWGDNMTDVDHSAALVEVAGRLCYKSFGTELNPNITRVRSGNALYMKNIMESGHGSVLAHAAVTFGFIGVSRVFTHELVRHAIGTGISQESMRFVSVESIRFYYPSALLGHGAEIDSEVEQLIDSQLRAIEVTYKALLEKLIREDMPFSKKKKITSALRRILPDGILTDIIFTANHRAWRHIVEVRTSEHAEEEIRTVMNQVAGILCKDHPTIYQDVEFNDLEKVTAIGHHKI